MKVINAKIGALFAVLLILVLSAAAKPPISKSAKAAATVIARVPGLSADAMFLFDNGDERYLYSEQASHDDFAIVNVTNPSKPNVVKRANLTIQPFGQQLRPVGGNLALTEASEAGSATASIPSARTVRILDLSDPANPQIVLSFSGVTSTLADEARSLVYVSNNEGLWIVRNNQALAAAAQRHACTSSDAFNELASCE
jgi:hypothetical protein